MLSIPTRELLKQWKQKCLELKKAYYLSSQRYVRLDAWLRIPPIVITAILSAVSIGSINNNSLYHIIVLVTGILGGISTTFNILQNKLDLGKKATGYSLTYRRLSSFITRIEKELILQQKDEDTLINDISKTLIGIVTDAPELPLSVVNLEEFEIHKQGGEEEQEAIP